MSQFYLDSIKEENIAECRACLQEITTYSTFYNLFDGVEQMGSTIAEKLSNIACVQITEADELPKVICDICYTLLQSAHSFVVTVKKTDQLLRQKSAHINQQETEKEWPKPIQISSNVECTIIPHMEIKDEVLSEEECLVNHKSSNEHIPDLEVKIEPNTLQDECDFSRPKINGVCSLNNIMEEEYLDSPCSNGNAESEEMTKIKEEPASADEVESVDIPDLPSECMLCTKKFNSVTGLKAHVITQHSYKGVKRKIDDIDSPQKVEHPYVCEICKRAFATSTDLMVHETCHNKCKCYLCNQSFATFAELSQHRLSCCEIRTLKTTGTQKSTNVDSKRQRDTTLQEEKKCKKRRGIEIKIRFRQ